MPTTTQKPAPQSLSLPPDPSSGAPELSFTLIRDRHTTIRIVVRPDRSVQVKAPQRLRQGEILRAVHLRRAWIQSKLTFFSSLPQVSEHHYLPGDEFLYLGKAFRLYFQPGPAPAGSSTKKKRGPSACLDGPFLRVYWNQVGRNAPNELSAEDAFKAISAWRMQISGRLLEKRLARLHLFVRQMLGDQTAMPPLKIRKLKRRWGSCSRRGEITLALQLSALPLRLVDYVIVHELCHLRHFDHSRHFHALVAKLCPRHRELEQELKTWSLARASD